MKTSKSYIRIKWFCILLIVLMLAIACFMGCSPTEDDFSANGDSLHGGPTQDEGIGDENPPLWASNFDLPNAEVALKRLQDIYGGANKVFLLQSNKIARMPCPAGETIMINVTCEVGEYAKLILDDSIAEFNEVFAFINPNYKFAINYSPDEESLTKKYSVKLAASDNLASTETKETFGVAHINYYNNFTELGDFGITIKREVFNNGSYLLTTFKHELMHLLGAGDAYKNPDATTETVMQSYTVNGYHHLSSTDVAFLDALYRNPEFASEDEKILRHINTYEEKSLHTKGNLTAAVYNKLVLNLDSEEIMSQAAEMGYMDLTEFFAAIMDGIEPDSAFGSKDISFAEIEYAETPNETYFGSIESQKKLYWHGRQTSVGSSQGISYIDYGNGILYAAPNGNLYTIMIKTGDFILAFRLSGGFTNFADLSLALWHISR